MGNYYALSDIGAQRPGGMQEKTGNTSRVAPTEWPLRPRSLHYVFERRNLSYGSEARRVSNRQSHRIRVKRFLCISTFPCVLTDALFENDFIVELQRRINSMLLQIFNPLPLVIWKLRVYSCPNSCDKRAGCTSTASLTSDTAPSSDAKSLVSYSGVSSGGFRSSSPMKARSRAVSPMGGAGFEPATSTV